MKHNLPLLFIGVVLVTAFSSSVATAQKTPEPTFNYVLEQAKAGDPGAQFNAGVRYATGKGVEKDDTKAYRWYMKAAQNQHPMAQNNLGAFYETGRAVTADQAKAVHWYTKAAEQGQKYAQNSLAIKLFNGEGTSKDPIMAYVYMRLSAEQGYKVADRNADVIYQTLSEKERTLAQMKLAEIWDKETKKYQQQMSE